jgi:membrane protein DedA with SNARE-associated domain
MESLLSLFDEYGLLLCFAAVFVEQIGPPIPSGPLLMIAGALANEERVYLGLGLVFSEQIDQVLILVERSGRIAIALLAIVIAYIAVKWWRRRGSVGASAPSVPDRVRK